MGAISEMTVERLIQTAARPVFVADTPPGRAYDCAIVATDATPAASHALVTVKTWMPNTPVFFFAVDTGVIDNFLRDPKHIMGETKLRDARRMVRDWASP